jgi:hypothetical protein
MALAKEFLPPVVLAASSESDAFDAFARCGIILNERLKAITRYYFLMKDYPIHHLECQRIALCN